MAFRVLFVCTGNICRSPAAELIFARLAAGQDIACASAGVTGLTGRGVDGPTAAALIDIGVDPAGHVARRITPGLVEAADLVLTAAADHRAVVLRETPSAFRRTFTLREFARLGAELGPLPTPTRRDALVERVVDVAEQRGLVDAPDPGQDNIGDPFGAGAEVARLSVLAVLAATEAAVRALGLTPAVTLAERDPDAPEQFGTADQRAASGT